MEHGASDSVKEQSHTVMSVKTEVDKAAQSTACRGVQINVHCTKEEPGLGALVKSEPALSVKEEVVEDGWQHIAGQQCVQGPLTFAIVGSTNVFNSSADLGNILSIKEELGATDIGSTVLQHMDTPYTNNQPDTSVLKQESTINGNNRNPISCGGVKEETIEDECRGEHLVPASLASQEVVTTNPGMCRTLPSLLLTIHKERLQSTCRVELTRLDISLHVKSPKANKQQRRAAGSMDIMQPVVEVSELGEPARKRAKLQTAKDARHSEEIQPGQRAQPRLYRCDKCPNTFKLSNSFRVHCKRVHATGSHECTECNLKYKCAEYLLRHIRNVHSEVQHKCAGCKKLFKSKQILRQHVLRCRELMSAGSELLNYVCDYCQKTYTTKYKVQIHITVVHTNTFYKCPQCNKSFRCKGYVAKHTAIVHAARMRECNVCGKPVNVHNLKRHMLMHSDKRGHCKLCGEVMKSQKYLHRHFKDCRGRQYVDAQHGEETQPEQPAQPRLYRCDKCPKTFTCKYSLDVHCRRDHGTGSHECTECNLKYKCAEYLLNHIRRAHSKQRNECAACKKIFKSKQVLHYHFLQCRGHRSAGSELRNYVCDYCQKKYKTKSHVRMHIVNVHANTTYKCRQCNKNFRSKQYVTRHTAKVHSAPMRECDVCGKSVKSYCLRKHMLNSNCNKKAETASKHNLGQHLKDCHTRQSAGTRQQFICSNCGKNFKTKWYWQKHESSCTRPTASNTSAVASTSAQQHSVVIVKEEPADGELDLGPVVFQHMDCNYRPYKQEPQLD